MSTDYYSEERTVARALGTERVSERPAGIVVTPAYAPLPLDLIRPGLVLVSPWHGLLAVLDVTRVNWVTTLTTRYPRSGQPMVTEHDAQSEPNYLDARVETDVRGSELEVGDLIIDREAGCWVEVTTALRDRLRDGTAAADSYWDRAYVDPAWELEQAQR